MVRLRRIRLQGSAEVLPLPIAVSVVPEGSAMFFLAPDAVVFRIPYEAASFIREPTRPSSAIRVGSWVLHRRYLPPPRPWAAGPVAVPAGLPGWKLGDPSSPRKGNHTRRFTAAAAALTPPQIHLVVALLEDQPVRLNRQPSGSSSHTRCSTQLPRCGSRASAQALTQKESPGTR